MFTDEFMVGLKSDVNGSFDDEHMNRDIENDFGEKVKILKHFYNKMLRRKLAKKLR